MRILYVISLISIVILLNGCFLFEKEEIEVKVKQVITLPTGTIIEASVPLNISAVITTLVPRVGDNEIREGSSFVIPVQVVNNDKEDYVDTKLMFEYEDEFIEGLYLYSWSKNPLEKIGEKIYFFDKDLKSTQDTKILLAGKVKNLPKGLEDGRVKFTLKILDNRSTVISTTEDTIVIIKNE